MEKNLEDKKYFDNYEENRIELEKKIKESKMLNDKLINENKKIINELDNKKKLINEYESELNKLNYEHNQKLKKIAQELNDKGISINKLNNEYKQITQELENILNNEKISLDEYKKEIQKLKELKKSKEYINIDKKNKNEILKQISELTKENQKYIKEKQIIEQELNKKEQELNNKGHELANNNKTINDLEHQIKLLNYKENDELKKNEAKNKISNKIKIFEDSSTPTKIPQNVRKRDDKARTFALEDFKKDSLPEYNEKSNRLENLKKEYNEKSYRSENLEKEYENANEEKIQNIKKNKFISGPNIKKLDFEKIEKELKDGKFYEYELNISDSRIKYFDKITEENPKMSAKKIDIINQLKSLYTIRRDYFKIYDPKGEAPNLRTLDDQIRILEDEFRYQKGNGTFASQNKFVKLLTLLKQLLTKNKSKKFKDDINQILKELYDSQQITKQVYNILNKSILYKNDS